MYEKTNRSKCCRAEVTYEEEFIGAENEEDFALRATCQRCKQACETDEVCLHCFGEGEVSQDGVDESGNTEKGVATRRCGMCKDDINNLI